MQRKEGGGDCLRQWFPQRRTQRRATFPGLLGNATRSTSFKPQSIWEMHPLMWVRKWSQRMSISRVLKQVYMLWVMMSRGGAVSSCPA